MSSSFVTNFLQMAYTVTDAERGMAFDVTLALQPETAGMPSSKVDDDIESIMREALEKGKPVLSNNMIRDPEDAPSTNVHLGGLRMILALPLQGHGVVYLDKPIKQGVFERDTVARLTTLANALVGEDATDLSSDDMRERYDSLD